MKISLLEPLGVSDALIRELSAPIVAQGHEFLYYPEKTTDLEELKRRSAGCEVVMIANNPYPAPVILAADRLKLLNVAFTGIDHVDADACRAKGVTVCNAANYSNQTVAELVIGMTIALLRKTAEGDRAVRSGGTSAGLRGREICGRTVGVIGLGRIGLITARLFLAFGARVIAHDPHESEAAKALGIAYVGLEELMRRSDIITLHTPNNASTRGLISRQLIAAMQPHAIFTNCARGPIVDNAALADALNAGAIAGAGIDVYDMEPPLPADYPLLHAKNTLLTPHVAFLSDESMIRRAHIAFQNTLAYLAGRPENVCSL
ncbi:MAG: hydroxyacid dehydrogenase [Clostridia bacterium]|nr:hydroxyacid dehydrogenase [Clostridia bacterium]